MRGIGDEAGTVRSAVSVLEIGCGGGLVRCGGGLRRSGGFGLRRWGFEWSFAASTLYRF